MQLHAAEISWKHGILADIVGLTEKQFHKARFHTDTDPFKD